MRWAINAGTVRSLPCALALICASLYALPESRAQEASAGGWLGVGAFGPRLATTVDVGADVAGETYAVGVGARLRYLAGEGFRSEDWDDLSEVLRVVRYAVYRGSYAADDGGDPMRVAVAAGALGGVMLGHGAVLDGYATGVDVDHGRVGAQANVDGGLVAFAALVDDVVAPRVAAARGQWMVGERWRVGFSVAGDLSAPSGAGAGPTSAEEGSEILPFVVADGEYRPAIGDKRFAASAYIDLASAVGVGSGAHLGGAGSALLGSGDLRVTGRSELRLGSDGYLAGWIGPLYELSRESQLAEARAGGLAGLGGLAEIGLEVPSIGGGTISYARRPGTGDLVALRLALPHLRSVQGAFWGAAELGGPRDGTQALSFELRARLPAEMFVLVEAARVYRTSDGAMRPLWIATTAVGGVVGE